MLISCFYQRQLLEFEFRKERSIGPGTLLVVVGRTESSVVAVACGCISVALLFASKIS